jgi:hypothetical protein
MNAKFLSRKQYRPRTGFLLAYQALKNSREAAVDSSVSKA